MTASKDIAIASLVLYLPLAPPALYVAFKHIKLGKKNFAPWLFVNLFLLMQIIGNIIVIADYTSIVGIIITSLGLTPLLVASQTMVMQVTRNTDLSSSLIYRKQAGSAFHLLTIAGAAVYATGAAEVFDPSSTPSDISGARPLIEAGVIIFLVLIIALTVSTIFALQAFNQMAALRKLFVAICICIPFFFLRITYSLLATFDTSSATFSPFEGSAAVRVVMEVLPLVAIAASLVTGGLLTRNHVAEDAEMAPQSQRLVKDVHLESSSSRQDHWISRISRRQ